MLCWNRLLPALLLTCCGVVQADIITDGSLGPQQQLIGPDFTIDADLGRQSGDNLFHSFDTFNVLTGESATFTGPASISRVISRVTGGSMSTIDGTLRVAIDNADLYLLNPQGFLFGENASFDLPAALHVGAADSLSFSDGSIFQSSVNAADDAQLSIAAPDSFGYTQDRRASVTFSGNSLQLGEGSTLEVHAPQISVENAAWTIPAGHLHLTNPQLEGEGGEIRIADSLVDISGDGAGEMEIRGGQLIFSNSNLYNANTGSGDVLHSTRIHGDVFSMEGGSVQNNTLVDGGSAPLEVIVQGELSLQDGAKLQQAGADGDLARLVVDAGVVQLKDGGRIQSFVIGSGTASLLTVTAADLMIDGGDGATTGIFNGTTTDAPGSGGESVVTISGETRILNGGQINSQTYGSGNSGDLFVYSGSLYLEGEADLAASSVENLVARGASGNAGNLWVEVDGALSLINGARIINATLADGDAGSLSVQAGELKIDRQGHGWVTGIINQAYSDTRGNAGDTSVKIDNTIEIINGGRITSSAFGEGHAGVVNIDAASAVIDKQQSDRFTGIASQSNPGALGDAGDIRLSLSGHLDLLRGGQIVTDSYTPGDAGDVLVEAASAHIDGLGSGNVTAISSQVNDGSSGSGGQVEVIIQGDLEIVDGAGISSGTFQDGNAGNVFVSAGNLTLDRQNSAGTNGIFSQANPGSTGMAGDVRVQVEGDLAVLHGSRISSDTYSPDDAGSVVVTTNSLLLDGGSEWINGITSQSFSTEAGVAGDVQVVIRERADILNGSVISSSTFSAGAAGVVEIQAGELLIDPQGATITGILSGSYDGSGDAGRVQVEVDGGLTIINGGRILTDTRTSGAAGDIQISADTLYVDRQGASRSTGITSQANPGSSGPGGDIVVQVNKGVELINGGLISATTFSSGNGGDIRLDAASLFIDFQDSQQLTGIASQVDPGASGDAGDIAVRVDGLVDIRGGWISSNTYSEGDAGNIHLEADQLYVDGLREFQHSGITSLVDRYGSGHAGNISLDIRDISLERFGTISIASYSDTAIAGSQSQQLQIVSEWLEMTGNSVISAESAGLVPAADIQIHASDALRVRQGSQIITGAEEADGGGIGLSGEALVVEDAVVSTSVTGASGNGGNITLSHDAIILSNGFIQANTAAMGGSGGDIQIDAKVLINPANQPLLVGGDQRYTFDPAGATNVIQAAAPEGVSGHIQVGVPQIDISGSVSSIQHGPDQGIVIADNPCKVAPGKLPSSLTAIPWVQRSSVQKIPLDSGNDCGR